MNAAVTAMIEKANNRAKAGNRKVFAEKASDQQHHNNLYKHCVVAMDIYHNNASLRNDNNFRAAMRELETAMGLSKRKLQS